MLAVLMAQLWPDVPAGEVVIRIVPTVRPVDSGAAPGPGDRLAESDPEALVEVEQVDDQESWYAEMARLATDAQTLCGLASMEMLCRDGMCALWRNEMAELDPVIRLRRGLRRPSRLPFDFASQVGLIGFFDNPCFGASRELLAQAMVPGELDVAEDDLSCVVLYQPARFSTDGAYARRVQRGGAEFCRELAHRWAEP